MLPSLNKGYFFFFVKGGKYADATRAERHKPPINFECLDTSNSELKTQENRVQSAGSLGIFTTFWTPLEMRLIAGKYGKRINPQTVKPLIARLVCSMLV